MKVNYQLEMEKVMAQLGEEKPTLLLHSCCGPCSSAVIERLSAHFRVTVFYYNPNIEPEEAAMLYRILYKMLGNYGVETLWHF